MSSTVDLSSLTAMSFLADRSYTPVGGTEPYPAPVAIRFKGIEPGDLSDKILAAEPGTPGPLIPTPTAALAGSVGLSGLMFRRRRG